MQPLTGMRDIFGDTQRRFAKVYTTAMQELRNYGFTRFDTPILENAEVFRKAAGQETDIVGKEMYVFHDKGNNNVALRPEGTAAIVRAIINGGLTQNLPLKAFYYGPMFRYERPQKGRFRQFYQLGVEYFGKQHWSEDVESIALAYNILQELGIETSLEINSLGDKVSFQNYRTALVSYLEPLKDQLSNDSQRRLDTNPLRILDSKDTKDIDLCLKAPKILDYLNEDSKIYFEGVCQGLDALKIPYNINQRIVRGIDYYCHTVFEFLSDNLGAQSAVLAGGRYDGLCKLMGGPDVSAVGWACGVDRLAMLLDESQLKLPKTKVAIIPLADHQLDALKLMQKLRSNNIACEFIIKNNLIKAFKEAEKRGCSFAITVGADELAQDKFHLKPLTLDIALNREQKNPDDGQQFFCQNKLIEYLYKHYGQRN